MADSRPNIIFIMSDDHAAAAISAYGSRITRTPNIDRLASGEGGMRFENCFVTNSICTPSRAAILTGTYNHVNRVTTLHTHLDNRLPNVAKRLRTAGYQTAMVGKWHLGEGPAHEPTGFDYWKVLPGQGEYHDPVFHTADGVVREQGYVTDIITEDSIGFLDRRDHDRPFFLMCHHKAPHRPWDPKPEYRTRHLERPPTPDTFDDDYANRARAAAAAKMRIAEDLTYDDLDLVQLPESPGERYLDGPHRKIPHPPDPAAAGLRLRDRGTGTVVMYTSDQGFFLGEHGWFDKRFIYEESLRMPFLVRTPAAVLDQPRGAAEGGGAGGGAVNTSMVCNVDFAPTFLELAGLPIPSYMQGRSIVPLLQGRTPADWPQEVYHRYWMNQDDAHNAYAHYGIRTQRYKLIYWYNDDCGEPGAKPGTDPPEWELFDLQRDPGELHNRYNDPAYAEVVAEMTGRLDRKMADVGDVPLHDSL